MSKRIKGTFNYQQNDIDLYCDINIPPNTEILTYEQLTNLKLPECFIESHENIRFKITYLNGEINFYIYVNIDKWLLLYIYYYKNLEHYVDNMPYLQKHLNYFTPNDTYSLPKYHERFFKNSIYCIYTINCINTIYCIYTIYLNDYKSYIKIIVNYSILDKINPSEIIISKYKNNINTETIKYTSFDEIIDFINENYFEHIN